MPSVSTQLPRDRETGELVRDTAYPDVQSMRDNALLPTDGPKGILDLLVSMYVGIASETTKRDIRLVWRQPVIGHMVAYLVGFGFAQPGTILGMSLMEYDPANAESERLIEGGKIANNRGHSLTWIIKL